MYYYYHNNILYTGSMWNRKCTERKGEVRCMGTPYEQEVCSCSVHTEKVYMFQGSDTIARVWQTPTHTSTQHSVEGGHMAATPGKPSTDHQNTTIELLLHICRCTERKGEEWRGTYRR